MATTDKPASSPLVACEVCLKEVPASEALVPEASDYVAHFCGLDCYQKWKSQGREPKKQPDKPGE